jgi:colanic acid biosynthesis glycosyl transferase WcaI
MSSRPRVLLLNQFFWPDSAATSQLLTDLACRLANQGCSVTVICGKSQYAAAAATSQAPPVRVLHVSELPFSRSRAGRLLSYVSFLVGASLRALFVQRPDLVVTLTTPPLLPVLGTLLKRLRSCRHYIWEMDVYPDVAVDLGVMNGAGVVSRLVGAALDFARRNADGVFALGECMASRLAARGCPEGKIHITENWANGSEILPLPFRPAEQLTVLYSGNLGLAHELETVKNAICRLNGDPRFRWVFAGGGPCHAQLEDYCRSNGFSQVSFRPYCSPEALAERLSEGDLGLVTQKPECLGSVVPSKIYGIMAAGRPVLYIGPRQSTPAQIVDRFHCGWNIDCSDVDGLLSLLRQLLVNRTLVREAGLRARQAFVQNYDLPIGVGRLSSLLGVGTTVEETAGTSG